MLSVRRFLRERKSLKTKSSKINKAAKQPKKLPGRLKKGGSKVHLKIQQKQYQQIEIIELVQKTFPFLVDKIKCKLFIQISTSDLKILYLCNKIFNLISKSSRY